MSTKFVSKNSNYMIVLRPGVEGSRALGTHSIPGLYVKFQSGTLDVKEEKILELLRAHPSYGIDFIEIKDSEIDPFLDVRQDSEPAHVITDMEYGRPKGMKAAPLKTKLTPAMKKVIEGEALKMLPGLLKQNPKILKDIILGLASEMKEKEEQEKEIPAKKDQKTAEK